MAIPVPTGLPDPLNLISVDLTGWHALWAAVVPVAAAAWKATGSVVAGLFRRWEHARESQLEDRDATIAALRGRNEQLSAEVRDLRDRLEQLAREHNPLLVRVLELVERHEDGKDRDEG